MATIAACSLPFRFEKPLQIPVIRYLLMSGPKAVLGMGDLLSNVVYRLQSVATLPNGDWLEVDRFIPTAPEREWTGTSYGERGFYRLMVE